MNKFLILNFVLVITAIMFIRPERFGSDGQNKPLLELKNYAIVKLTQMGQEAFLSAKLGQYFLDESMIDDINVIYQEDKHIKTIKAQVALLKKGIIYFQGKIDYKDNGLRILTHNLEYDTKLKSVLINDNFQIENKQNFIKGNYLSYRPSDDYIYIEGVNAQLQL